MAASDFTAPSLREILRGDVGLLPTDVLKAVEEACRHEIRKRLNLEQIQAKEVNALSHRIEAEWSSSKMAGRAVSSHWMEHLAPILAQDWSHLFPGGDSTPKYYVYAHIVPNGKKPLRFQGEKIAFSMRGNPFYVGKGCGERAFDMKRNQGHGATLRELLAMGHPTSDIAKVLVEGLTEAEAYEIESKLIYFFGTKYEAGRRGILINLDIPARPR